MKTFILPFLFSVIFTFLLMSFGDPYTIKRISDKDFRYEFYTIDKKIKPNKKYVYSWFKGGLIHEAQGGIAGDLLNDKFTKMYHNNQLAEQGQFRNGLRVGEWKTWYRNGILASIQIWNSGFRSGKFLKYDLNGNLIESGHYMTDLKTGKWINIENRDTINYRRGIVVIEKQKYTKSEKYSIKQGNIKLKNDKATQKELESTTDEAKLAGLKTKTKEEKEIAKEKVKTQKETKAATKKAEKEAKERAREQAKNEPKKESKIIIFFKNLLKKKDKATI